MPNIDIEEILRIRGGCPAFATITDTIIGDGQVKEILKINVNSMRFSPKHHLCFEKAQSSQERSDLFRRVKVVAMSTPLIL
jgi:hypothetical protein